MAGAEIVRKCRLQCGKPDVEVRPMATSSLDLLMRQFDTAWRLASLHLDGLSTVECLWRPAPTGLHVRKAAEGQWRADWPDHEGYDIGPPSIAWITWHMSFWWSMALDHSFGQGTLLREAVLWPGDADEIRRVISGLETEWRTAVKRLTDEDLASSRRTRWPFKNQPFADILAWANVELTKNAAEIGYVRFLYAVRAER